MTFTPDSAEAVNVRICELLGWKIHWPDNWRERTIQRPDGTTTRPTDPRVDLIYILPNYSGSLDAMHEAEKTLRVDELETYLRALVPNEQQWIKYPMNAYWLMTHATAAQRAAAFLTTKTRSN